jgi:VanZ family protein
MSHSEVAWSTIPRMPSTSKPARRAWVPALLWLAVIAWESTSLASSEHTAGVLLPILRFFFPQITIEQAEFVNAVARKAGHFIGYAVLSLLMLRAWWSTLMLPRWATRLPSLRAMLRSWSARAATIALMSSALVAALDEWHQAHLPGRTGTIHDVALDTMAAACVQLFVIAMSNVRPRNVALDS